MTTMANTMGKSIRKRTKPKQYANQNIIEALRSIPMGVAQSGLDFAKKTADIKQWETYLGFNTSEKKKKAYHGDLAPGQELDLRSVKPDEENLAPNLDIDPGIDYRREILNREKVTSQRLSQETKNNIQEILVELKKIVSATQELQTQFKEVAVIQTVVNPGKYHQAFFEWLLLTVRDALKKVEDSGAWLTVVKGKNAKRTYWDLADEKIGGTKFSLSSERIVATQVG